MAKNAHLDKESIFRQIKPQNFYHKFVNVISPWTKSDHPSIVWCWWDNMVFLSYNFLLPQQFSRLWSANIQKQTDTCWRRDFSGVSATTPRTVGWPKKRSLCTRNA
jgi:hypothetical protein